MSRLALIALLLLASCSQERMLDQAFEDRSKFTFEDPDGDLISYYCVKGETEAATKKRAQEAHIGEAKIIY